jgi:hypothetical protein
VNAALVLICWNSFSRYSYITEEVSCTPARIISLSKMSSLSIQPSALLRPIDNVLCVGSLSEMSPVGKPCRDPKTSQRALKEFGLPTAIRFAPSASAAASSRPPTRHRGKKGGSRSWWIRVYRGQVTALRSYFRRRMLAGPLHYGSVIYEVNTSVRIIAETCKKDSLSIEGFLRETGGLEGARGVSLNKLMEEWATVALAELDAENRYRLRVACGQPEIGLALLDKLDRSLRRSPAKKR